jgi:hypothetical protein
MQAKRSGLQQKPQHRLSRSESAERILSFSARKRALGLRPQARRQFAPAIHQHTRRFFLTLPLSGCQL